MLLGFHVSIAGGLPLAVKRAAGLGCTTMQIFSHSPRAWKLAEIPAYEAEEFKIAREEAGISPLFVHTSYLINLASADGPLHRRSAEALRTEMVRAEKIGADFVVTHLGSASGSPHREAVQRVSSALREAFDGLGVRTRLLLENTAGEAGDVGHRFGDIAEIIERSGVEDLGVAMDTCHSFGAGYDLKHKKGLDDAVREMDETFGLSRLGLIHLNDSKHPLGSRRDRHEHIGKGGLGKSAIRLVINHPMLHHLPFIMETPKKDPGDDERNMAAVKRLLRS